MKVVSRLLAALLVATLVVPLLATPILAATYVTSMTVRPSSSGPVGTEVHLIGDSDNDDEGWVYFELEEDEWILVLEDDEWEAFDEVETWNDPPGEWVTDYYEFETEPFEIPECVGGVHGIAILETDEGDTIDEDEVDANRAGTSAAIKSFEVIPEITILSDDDEGPAGSEVEIKGTGFGARESITVFFDGDEVEMTSSITSNDVGTWTGTFVVPAASQGTHEITAEGDDVTDESDVDGVSFSVTPGISVTPTSGAVGSEVTVTGSGFRASESGIEILFGSKIAKSGISANSSGIFTETVVVPAVAMGTHEVGAEGQYTDADDVDTIDFEVAPTLFVEPLTGPAGTEIEVSGAGLPANTAATVTYDGVTKGTGTTSSDGTLAAITFTATHTQTTHTTDHPVAAVFDSTTITETFVMESTTPSKPVPRSPASGTRLGILGKQTPTLTWSVVDDPSGVTYALQISTTPDFSQILISKSNLVAQGSAIVVSSAGTEMTYTLSEAEALPFGTYYWRVKAVDGAMNDSGWSASNTFKAGLLPTWALIVIIVLAAVLIGALIYVLIIRDRVGLYD